MSTVRIIAKNTIFLLMSQVYSLVLSFLFLSVSARYLGPVNFGILSFALAFTGIFSIFTDIGLKQYMTREVAKNKDSTRKYLGNVTGIKFILVGITAIAIVIVSELLGLQSPGREVVYIIAVSMFLNAITQTFYTMFQAHERMGYLSLGMVLESTSLLALAVFSIQSGADIVLFSMIYLFTRFIILIFCIVVSAVKFVRPTLSFDMKFWKDTMKHAWPFGLAGFFIVIYCWLDTIMLSFFWDSEAVGYYNAAFRLIMVTSFVPATFLAALFPVMARSFKQSKNDLKLIYRLTLKYMLMLAIPMAIGTVLLSRDIIILIFGMEFEPSAIALQILIWQSAFSFINYALAHLLNSINRQILVTKAMGLGMITNIVLNLIIIPEYGFVGASITTVITELVVVAILYRSVSKTRYRLGKRRLTRIIARILISSLAMAAAILMLQSYNIHLFLTIGSAIAIYFGISYLTKSLDRRDMAIFKQIIPKN